jgi:hypothetical protein
MLEALQVRAPRPSLENPAGHSTSPPSRRNPVRYEGYRLRPPLRTRAVDWDMLRGTVAFLVLIAFAVLATELRNILVRGGRREPAMEGISFLAVGLALGGRGLGLFPDDLLVSMRVVVLFGLAWIGLVFGVQVELRIIRRLLPWQRWAGWLTPAAIGLPVTIGALMAGLPTALSLGLGALAMAVSPSPLEGLARSRSIRDRSAVRLLKLVMAFAGLPAVIVFAVAAAFASPLAAASGGGIPTWQLVMVTAAVGALVGYALVVLARGVREHNRLLTLAGGSMCLVAGAAAVLGLSALPAAACAGAVLVNRSVFPNRMLRVAHSLERPMLVALLVLVGASWKGASFSLITFVLLTVVRAVAAWIAGEFLQGIARSRRVVSRTAGLGLGLVPQGELALGLLVAIVSFFPDTSGILEAVVAAIIVNNIVGAWWMRRWLAGTDEDVSEP